MPQLSILVPAAGSQAELDDTLVSVLEHRPHSCEVILICSPSYEDPYNLQDEVRLVRASGAWCDLLNAGLREALAPVVHPLMPGVLAAEGWTNSSCQRLQKSPPSVMAVAPYVTHLSRHRESCGVSISGGGRRQQLPAGRPVADRAPFAPSWHGGFYRAQSLREIGGWNPAVASQLADVELALRIASQEWEVLADESCRLMSTRRDIVDAASEFEVARDSARLRRTYYAEPASTWHGLTQALSALPHPGRVLGRLAGHMVGRGSRSIADPPALVRAHPMSRAA